MPRAPKTTISRRTQSPPLQSPHHSEEEAAKPVARPSQKSRAEKAGSSRSKTKQPNPIPEPANGMPTNKTLPTTITFSRTQPGCRRLSAWNVAGLTASQKKGFYLYVEAEDADILVLTETKVNGVPNDPAISARYPHCTWSISETKGYAGTAVLSKCAPLSVSSVLPNFDRPEVVKGRIITVEFPSCWVVATYVPNAGEKLKNLDVKNEWNIAFEHYIHTLDQQKPVIWLGDLNVAPTSKDLKNDKTNWNKTAGYTEAECSAFARTLAPKPDGFGRLVDVWRELHPDDEHYTYFSYRFNARAKQLGWRLDMVVISERLLPRVEACEIRHEIYGASDHLPVVLDLKGDL